MRYKLYPDGRIVDIQQGYKYVGFAGGHALTRLVGMRDGKTKDAELAKCVAASW